ncbi:UNVERIFIED_CONTAM: Stachyose synthase [Sesamum angustifolium]|uniref:Stachyose synthase n=1 Tax=Sesamum angustifolium TaxID=2727405 RepID=A0AAW2QVZ8_9LAMI
MTPPSDPVNSTFTLLQSSKTDNSFQLRDGKLSVQDFPLLTEIPTNVTFKPFSSVCQSSEAPLPLFQRANSLSFKGDSSGSLRTPPLIA